jgi:hypothetical protein
MAYNLGQLRQAIQNLGYTTDTAAAQNQFINAVYHEICGMNRWKFLEKQDKSLTTVAGTDSYTLPFTDWRNLDAVRIEVTANQQFNNLNYKPEQQFRELQHIDRDQSTPYFWTYMNNKLMFYPVPDNAYIVTIDYTYEPPDLVADTDVPVIPQPYQDILVWGAVEYMAMRERDWLGRQFAQQKAQTLIQQLKEEYFLKQRQTASHVAKSGYWETQLPYPFIQTGF